MKYGTKKGVVNLKDYMLRWFRHMERIGAGKIIMRTCISKVKGKQIKGKIMGEVEVQSERVCSRKGCKHGRIL